MQGQVGVCGGEAVTPGGQHADTSAVGRQHVGETVAHEVALVREGDAYGPMRCRKGFHACPVPHRCRRMRTSYLWGLARITSKGVFWMPVAKKNAAMTPSQGGVGRGPATNPQRGGVAAPYGAN